jgi:hypothetical protein
MTFAVVPWIFVMMERIKERPSLLNIVLLTIIMSVMIAGTHVQMVFYAACAVGFYLVCDLTSRIIKKETLLPVIKLIGVFIIATTFAVLMSADRYLVVLEYTPYSTRGSAPITARLDTNNTDKELASKKSEDDYKYATQWSNSPEEMIDMFNPSYHGFGKVKYKGILTNHQETTVSTY